MDRELSGKDEFRSAGYAYSTPTKDESDMVIATASTYSAESPWDKRKRSLVDFWQSGDVMEVATTCIKK